MSTPNPRATYAPPESDSARLAASRIMDDPIRLSRAVVAAVDAIGERSAAEYEKCADDLEAQTKETAGKLRQLAAAIRAQSRLASERISEHCLMHTTVVTTLESLQSQINEGTERAKVDKADDDGAPVPAFLVKGNGNGVSHD